VPELLMVTVWAGLVVPTVTVPKFKLLGETLRNVPVPLSETDCGLPGALSVTRSDLVIVPCDAGLNCTLIVQEAPAATLLPQVLLSRKEPLLP
jgi:hypothetical protein